MYSSDSSFPLLLLPSLRFPGVSYTFMVWKEYHLSYRQRR
jgi:hypothetical protein